MFITPAFAQSAGAAGPSAAGGIISMLPLVLVFIAFYFLMIRPQQRRVKALQESVNSVKKNDQVVTAGGLLGKVTKVEEKFVELEIAPNVKVRAVKATLAEVISAAGSKPAND